MRSRILVLLVAIAAVTGCGGSSSRSSPGSEPPRDASGELVGVMFDGPVLSAGVNLNQQLDLALASGVESLRVSADWATMEPAPRYADLPAAYRPLSLMGFYWYTWMGDETSSSGPYAGFDYAGLLKYTRGTIEAKPALDVYKHWALTIERCRSKCLG